MRRSQKIWSRLGRRELRFRKKNISITYWKDVSAEVFCNVTLTFFTYSSMTSKSTGLITGLFVAIAHSWRRVFGFPQLDPREFNLKLNSYLNASVFLSLCRMRISVFWGQERLTDRSILKRYLKSDIATRVEKKFNFKSDTPCDTGFY